MKPTIPKFDQRQHNRRNHPFSSSRELKGNKNFFPESNESGFEETEISPRYTMQSDLNLSIGTNLRLDELKPDVLRVSKKSFNTPISNRLSVQALEEATHKQLKNAFEEQNENRISKYERHILQIQILDSSMKDLCGLINKNCKDQANFVWKLWSSAADLYQEVFKQLMEDIEINRRNLVSASLREEELERRVNSLSKQHGLYTNNNRGNSMDELVIIRQLEEELNAKDADFLRVQETLTNLSLWFPHFSKFGGSVLGRFLPPFSENDAELLELQEKRDNDVQDDIRSLKDHFYLAQNYLLYDLKRLEKLGIGLEVNHSDPRKPSSVKSQNPYSYGASLTSHRPRREMPHVSNKLSIALNQPEELQALSYGLFGGPQSSVSFSAPQENEYNLRHIEHASASMITARMGSVLTNSVLANTNFPNVNAAHPSHDEKTIENVDEAVSRAVAAVTQSRHDSGKAVPFQQQESSGKSHFRNSPDGDFDIRQFHNLQFRRASNLSIADDNHLHGHHHQREEIDLNQFVPRTDFDLLSYTHHQAMVTIQELERNSQQENSKATSRIERLEKELLQCQQREKQLREQLNECKNEADSILVCLPLNCSLPPICTRTDLVSNRKGLALPLSESLSHFTVYEAMEKVLNMLDNFVFCGTSKLDVPSWNRSYRTVDNTLNGHSLHWFQIEPRSIDISVGINTREFIVHSVAIALLAPPFGTHNWQNGTQTANEVKNLASSVIALVTDEILRSYKENHLTDRFCHSSLTPWEMAPLIEQLQDSLPQSSNRNLEGDLLLFLSRLLGFRITVVAPEKDYFLHSESVQFPSTTIIVPEKSQLQQYSLLEVGLTEGSVTSQMPHLYDIQHSGLSNSHFSKLVPSEEGGVQIQKPAPPVPYLEEVSLRDQRIFFDICVHCFEAVKSCGTRKGFFLPISDISRAIRKVFEVLDISSVKATPFSVAQSLLDEHGVHMRPWWRYLAPSIERRLNEECLRMVIEDDRLASQWDSEDEGEDNDDKNRKHWMSHKHESLSLAQFAFNCHQAVLQFEQRLKLVLQEMFHFIQSLAMKSVSSPLFISILEVLLQPSLFCDPVESKSRGKVTNRSDEESYNTSNLFDRKTPALPLSLLNDLTELEARQTLTASSFAEAVLRCAPSRMVDHLSQLICLQDHKHFEQNRSHVDIAPGHQKETHKPKVGLDEIARYGLNLNLLHKDANSDICGNIIGTPVNDSSHQLGIMGILLLRYVEHLMFSSSTPNTCNSETSVSINHIRNPASLQYSLSRKIDFANQTKSTEKVKVPPLKKSMFMQSVHYRRILYGNSEKRSNHSHRDTEDTIFEDVQTNESDYDDKEEALSDHTSFATRLLLHLRLCFDPDLLTILDASLAHKWFTVRLVEMVISCSDVRILRDKCIASASPNMTNETFSQLLRKLSSNADDPPCRLSTLPNDLHWDRITNESRAANYRAKKFVSKTFSAWKGIISRKCKNK